ncbi:MAG TPA: NTF2-like N-terminal transpeptidase domain-containing protein, partial [Myxococcota bacterium]|nr:NTF2-like N-terminal transpeptidase domain-containing protein [Myxococcota bacterium]
MSRRYRQSPVFYDPTPARWPWVLALLVIAAIVAGAMLRPDLIPLGRLNEMLARGGAPAASEPTPELAAAPPQDGTPAAASDPSPAPAMPDMAPDEVAAQWVARWNAGDYAGMYDLASGTVRRALPLEEFVGRYQGIADRAQLSTVRAEVTGDVGDTRRVPIQVAFESGIVGNFSEENSIPLVREETGWRVAWTPSLIFSELGNDGCVDIDLLPSG